jgi:hypothetical protein
MNYLKKVLFAHSIIIISLLLCSCGTKHYISNNVIYKDDNFTYNQLINTSQLMDKIGKESYFSIMKKFEVEQILTSEDMQVIRESMPDISYIVMAYIEDENISNESYTESTANDEGKYETVYQTTKSLAVEFQIYDLLKEQLVWNNIIYNEAVETQSRTEDSFLGVVVGDVISSALVTIDREEVLEEIYEKFAEDLAEIKN